jgi:hypothetical protein
LRLALGAHEGQRVMGNVQGVTVTAVIHQMERNRRRRVSCIVFIKPESGLVSSAMGARPGFMGAIVPTKGNTTAQQRAEAAFKIKAVQLAERQKALAEYEANAVLVREKTARLRALRLAREAEGKAPVERRTSTR